MPNDGPRARSLLAQMTLEEKVSLLAGDSMWTVPAIPRLGIPALKVTDGPNGARGGGALVGGKKTACFPAGISLASTWDPDLLEQVGRALAQEALDKGARVLLGPTVNLHRSPLNGRTFECFSEDPVLAAQLAVAYIRGLQRRGVAATVKHYAGNESEFERNTINTEARERTLRELYLLPFEAAVRQAGTWCLMASYNRLNGVYASEHPALLTEILRDEWGWDGVAMSDWFATHSTGPALVAGLDLEMPGPPRWRGEKLVAAVREGAVPEAAVDASVARLLHLLERVGAFEQPTIPEEQAIDRPEHRALIRRAAAQGVVLLQNRDRLLPLDPATLRRLAVIGPAAKSAIIMGGGSAQVNAHSAVTPFAGIAAQLGPDTRVDYALGCTNHRLTPPLDITLVTAPNGSGQGFAAAFYNGPDFAGEPVWQTTVPSAQLMWMGQVGPGVDGRSFSLRLGGRFTPEATGTHTFGLGSAGPSRLSVDGRPVVDNWTAQNRDVPNQGFGGGESWGRAELEAGRPVELLVEYQKAGAAPFAGLRLGLLPPRPADPIAEAADLARQADVAVVCIGTGGEWESEGFDRPDMALPGRQDELVAAVAAANPRTVVVVQTGSPVAMPWLAAPAAVLEAWFPGEECGNAIADVLFGRMDACGRLPLSFPQRLADNPAALNYPGELGRVSYGEGVFIGYRYYDAKGIAPLFPFGFGLSYTSFAYADLRLSGEAIGPDDTLAVSVDVTNSGDRAGAEVVQLYVRDPAAAVQRPPKELKAFARVELRPGERRTVTLHLDRRSLAYYDDRQRRWVAEAGDFEVLIGRSAAEIVARAKFRLTESAAFDGPGRRLELTLDSPLHDLLADQRARAVLDRHLPGFSSGPTADIAGSFSLREAAAMAPGTLSDATLAAIAADLAPAAPAA